MNKLMTVCCCPHSLLWGNGVILGILMELSNDFGSADFQEYIFGLNKIPFVVFPRSRTDSLQGIFFINIVQGTLYFVLQAKPRESREIKNLSLIIKFIVSRA